MNAMASCTGPRKRMRSPQVMLMAPSITNLEPKAMAAVESRRLAFAAEPSCCAWSSRARAGKGIRHNRRRRTGMYRRAPWSNRCRPIRTRSRHF